MMIEPSIQNREVLTALPPEWPDDLLPAISERVRAANWKIAVLDDDPTGTQTVHDVPVLTTWAIEDLTAEMRKDHPVFFILTNSRSLDHSEACALNKEIGANLNMAAKLTGVEVEVVSRSDSTLRGHFPGEIQALKEVTALKEAPCLIIPFFLEGGRFSVNDIHYVAEGDRLIPAAQTAYAKDEVFGYRQSNLRRWVEEKTKGLASLNQIASISLEDIRQGGPSRISKILAGLPPESNCVVNAVSYRDLEVLVSGLLSAEAQGHRFIFRTAASFVCVRAGIQPRGLLESPELKTEHTGGGLFVVGSHVPKTSVQLDALLTQAKVAEVEINVLQLLDNSSRVREIERAAQEVNDYLVGGEDVVLYTSRDLVRGRDAAHNLDIGKRVSDGLIRVVQKIHHRPRYLVAKGGITSSNVATIGLGVRRAMVLGQILPGVPVWKLGPETRHPQMAYIVFPGNVGETNALVSITRFFD
jgi:uncharacterized protein YgbK (DUF1537 family)